MNANTKSQKFEYPTGTKPCAQCGTVDVPTGVIMCSDCWRDNTRRFHESHPWLFSKVQP